MTKEAIAEWFQGLQDRICGGLEQLDGAGAFQEDPWDRPGGGGGRSRVISGQLIEKGGVNFSAVHGDTPEAIQKRFGMAESQFFATGVSIVLHPHSPLVPIIHMNVRYFEMDQGPWWFGGGIDLTPHYVVPQLAGDFHRGLQQVCHAHGAERYPAYKKWADDYFYLPHREETRGVGGIFFDRLQQDFDRQWAFVQAVGESFVDLYSHQVAATRHQPYTPDQRAWQQLRRGRYVEFNLVHDAGTKFGLESGGRTESILMSMPPRAEWVYQHQPAAGSAEADTLNWLKKDINWLTQ